MPAAVDYQSDSVQTASTKRPVWSRLSRKAAAAAWLAAAVAAPVAWLQIRIVGTAGFVELYARAGEWLPATVRGNPFIAAEGATIGLLALCALVIVARKTRFFKASGKAASDSALHGTADWASFDDMREMAVLPPAVVAERSAAASFGSALWRALARRGPSPPPDPHDGVFIGAYVHGRRFSKPRTLYLRHNGPEHVLAFAPTRSGKGVGLVLPTLLTWRESALVHDPKGEAWALTSGFRHERLGQRVFHFDPANADTARVAAFNPLAEIRVGTSWEVGDAQNVATILVDPDGRGLKDHWDKTGQALMSALILHCCYAARNEQNRPGRFADVVRFFCVDDEDGPASAARPQTSPMYADQPPESGLVKRLTAMKNYDHRQRGFGDDTTGPHPMIAEEAQSMLNKEEREQTSVASTVISNLTLYRDPTIAANTGRSDWRIADLMHAARPATAYLVVRPSDADRLRPLMRLIATQIVRALTNEMDFRDGRSVANYRHRLLLMLDEFTALKKLSVVEEALAYMAGYGIKAYLIVQDIQQLEAVYGKEETIISNCHVRLCFAPNKIQTADVISRMAGKRTVVHKAAKTASKKGEGGGDAWQETARDLITPEEVMRLRGATKNPKGDITRPGDLLVFVAGHRPIYGTQVLYFIDPRLNERSKIPAPAIRYGERGDASGYEPVGERVESDRAAQEGLLDAPQAREIAAKAAAQRQGEPEDGDAGALRGMAAADAREPATPLGVLRDALYGADAVELDEIGTGGGFAPTIRDPLRRAVEDVRGVGRRDAPTLGCYEFARRLTAGLRSEPPLEEPVSAGAPRSSAAAAEQAADAGAWPPSPASPAPAAAPRSAA